MNCPACGEPVQPGQRFCPSCGERLERACVICGEALPETARFCPACGTAVGDAPAGVARRTAAGPSPTAEPTVERRRVSVVFVDLVGFTSVAARADPEDVRDLQSRYFTGSRDIVERYGGTVEKFIGDAVMAVWGAPTANEDDAERATRAALDLVAAVPLLAPPVDGSALSARAGVASGEAAVTAGADGQGMVSGETVNLAARLQSEAAPGTVLVDEVTRRATEAALVLVADGERRLKGFPDPVPTWRADRVVAGRGGRLGRSDELEAPFVGRSADLTLLKELFHATAREHRLRAVSITGQAGIGKSRLVWEFEKYLDGVAGGVWWHEGRSPAYGEGITFWALGEMIRRRAGISDDDDEPTTRGKLRQMLELHVADEAERGRIEPALAVLLGLDSRGTSERGELFGAWRTLFERMSDRDPVVLVFEDLQWADGGLVDFVTHLLEWSRQRPIFIVTVARPELLERFPTWGAGQRNFTSLHLEPLPDADMHDLLAGLVPGLPTSTVRAILSRAEGVPLYAVETVRMLMSDGLLVRDGATFRVQGPIDRVSIPATLHALVAARIDGLAAPDRLILQHASVLGSTFSIEGLAAVSGPAPEELRPALQRLVTREMLRLESDPRSPERGQHQFVQAVIREVAYGTLTRRDRKERHLAAARYFEVLGDEELAGALARHYLEAWRAAADGPEADALAAQARVALRGAADRATTLHSYDQALAFLTLALDVAADPAERATLLERAGGAAWNAARETEADELLRGAVDAYRALDDSAGVVRCMVSRGLQHNSRGRPDEAVRILTEAESALPEDSGAEPLLAELRVQLARAQFLAGNRELAIELVDSALATAEQHDLIEVLLDGLVTRGSALMFIRPREGRATLHGAIALADQYDLPMTGLRARNNLAVALSLEDPRGAGQLVRDAMAIAERLGLRGELQWAKVGYAFELLDIGDLPEAARAVGEILAEDPLPEVIRFTTLPLAVIIATMAGDFEEAHQRMDEADSLGATVTNPEYQGGVEGARAFLLLMEGDGQAAAEVAEAFERRAPVLGPAEAMWMGRAYARSDRLDDARRQLQRLNEPGARGRLVDAGRTELEAALAAATGRPEAATLYREAVFQLRALDRFVAATLALVDFALRVGADDADGRAAAAEARSTCLARGWLGPLAILDGLLGVAESSQVPAEGSTAAAAPGKDRPVVAGEAS